MPHILALMAATGAAHVAPLAPHPGDRSYCAEMYINAHGAEPSEPKKPADGAGPAEMAKYTTALAAYHQALNAYQAGAKSFGRTCIFSDKPPKDTTPTEATALLKTVITEKTRFVSNPPDDVAAFCPNYANLSTPDRLTFWQTFFVSIIPHESEFHNSSIMIDGEQYSIGLYQLSSPDGGCPFKTEADVADPAKNTACAVHKMEILASGPRYLDHEKPPHVFGVLGGQDGHSEDGAARYWSTLRYKARTRPTELTSRETITRATMASPGCSSQH